MEYLPSVVVVGCQWGDEGKGKIVDYLASKADYVTRFQGGSNAGHTINVGGETYKLRLLPSGVLHRKKLVIANGVVVDPTVLIQEISDLTARGYKPDLALSDRANVTLTYHQLLDAAEEQFKGALRSGTTLRGIGPTYTDKVARYGIRVCDLLDEDILKQKIMQNATLKQKTLSAVYGSDSKLDETQLFKTYLKLGDDLRTYVTDTSLLLNEAIDNGRRVLFEGAQGLMLDIDHGMYPFGTSSNTTAGAVSTGAGVGPKKIDEILGVVKAYTSRVGAGPVPTELKDEVGSKLQEKGKEFGTVTGRRRRCGWIDGVTLRFAARINSLTGVALTKMDTLGGFNPVKICTKYEIDKRTLSEQPAGLQEYSKCKPVYEDMEGWPDLPAAEWSSIAKKGYDSLPSQARRYVERIEEIMKVQVKLISIGEAREATIYRSQVWPS